MLKNYFTIAWRNLVKHRVFSAINIIGLSTGLTCCILIFLFIQNELSYDGFNKQGKKIYRITSIITGSGNNSEIALTPAPWAPIMKKDFPGIKEYTRLLKDEKVIIGAPGEQHFNETNMLFADSSFFEVFSVNLVQGEAKHALGRPNSIVLTTETARKFFGTANAIGKTLEVSSFGRNFNVEVTAIADPVPAASHFHFNSIVSMQTLGDLSGMWSFHMFHSYLLLNDHFPAASIEKQFPGFGKKYITNNPAADGKNEIHLQALSDIHLKSHLGGELETNGNITYVYVFAGVALFILLIACFNFINLTTARSLSRAKEVGLRKVIGAGRYQLLSQFLTETVLFALFALVVAVALAYALLPLFNSLSGRHLSIDLQHNYPLLVVLTALVIVVGLVSGLYPAILLSAFRPVKTIKGKIGNNRSGATFRKVLVTIQFMVSMILIAFTIFVSRQLHFLQTKDPGFNRENVAIITLPGTADSLTLASFKSSLLSLRSVKSVSATSAVPGDKIAVNLVNDGGTDLTKALSMQMLFVDMEFVSMLQMQLLSGRNFDKLMTTDKTQGFIINEEAVKRLGWKNTAMAIGKTIQWVNPDAVIKKGVVIGVVKDFNITPLRVAVQPLVMHYLPQRFKYIYVRFDEKNISPVMSGIQQQFNLFYAKKSFEYSFLDEDLNDLYVNEEKLGIVVSYFSILAIVIACMGTLGLSLYSIQQKIKEIGIRKILGASVFTITVGLFREFVIPVILAALVATPIAWFAINKWLENFAYHIKEDWTVFIWLTLSLMALTIITMSIQSVRAAVANPVASLRSE